MVVLDKTIHVHAAPDRVWRYVTSLARAPEWSPGLVRAVARDGAPDLRPGTVFTTVREDLGLHLESEQVTLQADPPRRFAWRQRAGDFARNDGCYELAAVAGGDVTRVHLRVALELPFVLPRLLTEDAIRRHFSARFDAALIALKRRLESAPKPLSRPGSLRRS